MTQALPSCRRPGVPHAGLYGQSKRIALYLLLLLVMMTSSTAQEFSADRAVHPAGAADHRESSWTSRAQESIRHAYRLGPDDEVKISVWGEPEFGRESLLLDADGHLHLPLVGKFQAAGLTVAELQAALAERLQLYLREPQVAVQMTAFRSQPVAVMGAVRKPGAHALRGPKSLVEILSMAGGLSEDAGQRVRITRRTEQGVIPLPDARVDATGKFSVAAVDLTDITAGRRPELNILIRPHDLVAVPRADMVYVVGAVHRAGGFGLREGDETSVMQALALAGGVAHPAALKKAKILRRGGEGSSRSEIPVDLKKIIEGGRPDVPLHKDDILFVPRSGGKAAARAAAEAVIRAGTGIAILGLGR